MQMEWIDEAFLKWEVMSDRKGVQGLANVLHFKGDACIVGVVSHVRVVAVK